jgi:hypothetical protein
MATLFCISLLGLWVSTDQQELPTKEQVKSITVEHMANASALQDLGVNASLAHSEVDPKNWTT